MKRILLVLCIFCFIHPSKALSRYEQLELKSLLREESQLLRRIGQLGNMMTDCTKYELNSSTRRGCEHRQDVIRARYIAFDMELEEVRMELEEFEE